MLFILLSVVSIMSISRFIVLLHCPLTHKYTQLSLLIVFYKLPYKLLLFNMLCQLNKIHCLILIALEKFNGGLN
jgi:hypothetical protein